MGRHVCQLSRLVLCVVALLAALLSQAAGGGQRQRNARNFLENTGSLVTQTPFFATLDCDEVLKRLTFDRPFLETVIRFPLRRVHYVDPVSSLRRPRFADRRVLGITCAAEH
jgi:hypothetical protein